MARLACDQRVESCLEFRHRDDIQLAKQIQHDHVSVKRGDLDMEELFALQRRPPPALEVSSPRVVCG